MAHLIHATCASCGHTVKVQASFAGRKARCPKCQGIIQIPKPAEVSAPPPGPDSDPAPMLGEDFTEQTRIGRPNWEPPENPLPQADFEELEEPAPPESEMEDSGLDRFPPPRDFSPPPDDGLAADPVDALSPFAAPRAGGAGRRSSHGGTAGRGRKSSIYLGQAPKAPSRLPVILTGGFAVTGILALGVALLLMFRKPGPAPTPTPVAETTPPSPTPSEVPPAQKLRDEIEARTRAWLEAFNSNDPDRLEPFYTISKRDLLQICERDFLSAEIRYENFQIAEVTTGPETSYARVKYDRVRTEKASRLRNEEPGREKLLTWRKSGSTWVLSGPPEP